MVYHKRELISEVLKFMKEQGYVITKNTGFPLLKPEELVESFCEQKKDFPNTRYSLTDKQKKKMIKHKSTEVSFCNSSGIGTQIKIKTKKGKWKDITDYSCW